MDFINQIYSAIMSPDVNFVGATYKLVLGFLLGAVVGFERRRKGQIAGMRTFALISMGATLAMLVSIYIPQEYLGLKNGDPGRIAAQVISGVGFLGAGAIIQMKGSVRGLTTAAGIWITACIGLAVGAGMYMIATVTTLLIIFVLVNIERLEMRAHFLWEAKVVRVRLGAIVTDVQPLRDLMTNAGVEVTKEFIKFDYQSNETQVNFMVRTKPSADIAALFSAMHDTAPVLAVTLTNETNV